MEELWIRLEKGRYIHIDNIVRVERGPVGHGVKVVFIDGSDETYTGSDATTIIARFEAMLVRFEPRG